MSKDSKETPSREQRALARLECRVFVHYRIEAEDTFKAGLARDIGEGGIKFEAGWPIPPHTVLRLAIQLPLHRGLLKAKAEVVSANESGANGSYDIGAKFLDIGKKDMKMIARYIDDITSNLEGEYSEEPEREIPQVFAERGDLSVPAGGRADLAAGPEKAWIKRPTIPQNWKPACRRVGTRTKLTRQQKTPALRNFIACPCCLTRPVLCIWAMSATTPSAM